MINWQSYPLSDLTVGDPPTSSKTCSRVNRSYGRNWKCYKGQLYPGTGSVLAMGLMTKSANSAIM
jgi:hypothetical protein